MLSDVVIFSIGDSTDWYFVSFSCRWEKRVVHPRQEESFLNNLKFSNHDG